MTVIKLIDSIKCSADRLCSCLPLSPLGWGWWSSAAEETKEAWRWWRRWALLWLLHHQPKSNTDFWVWNRFL